MPGRGAMWTESCKLEKGRCRKSDSVEKACVEGGGESAEAEEVGCWGPGALCQEVLGSS